MILEMLPILLLWQGMRWGKDVIFTFLGFGNPNLVAGQPSGTATQPGLFSKNQTLMHLAFEASSEGEKMLLFSPCQHYIVPQ